MLIQRRIANAAVLFPDTFRIVLRAKKAEGRQTYEAVLVSLIRRPLALEGPTQSSVEETEALYLALPSLSAYITILPSPIPCSWDPH
jgi:hypothetical protein